ncbi:MAG: hypothetical protein D6798_11690 [Deltaproteobacteria bacterium]|nr:MAG: hypothetical protein D6798_11690 [Deltaproteobacteria bacterium]
MHRPPPPKVSLLAHLTVALLLTTSAVADASASTTTNDDSCGTLPEPGARGAMELSWTRGVDGWTQPVLQVRTPDVDGLSARLDARLVFAGQTATWSTEAEEVPAYTTVELSLEGLDDKFFDDEQVHWLSDLSVQVVLLDGEGTERMRQGAPLLHVAWDEHGALILDDDETATLSTGGAWSAAAEEEVAASNAAAGDDGLITWYGEVTP